MGDAAQPQLGAPVPFEGGRTAQEQVETQGQRPGSPVAHSGGEGPAVPEAPGDRVDADLVELRPDRLRLLAGSFQEAGLARLPGGRLRFVPEQG
jgi:hypothetical protein